MKSISILQDGGEQESDSNGKLGTLNQTVVTQHHYQNFFQLQRSIQPAQLTWSTVPIGLMMTITTLVLHILIMHYTIYYVQHVLKILQEITSECPIHINEAIIQEHGPMFGL